VPTAAIEDEMDSPNEGPSLQVPANAEHFFGFLPEKLAELGG
jgi:hypothetical protein